MSDDHSHQRATRRRTAAAVIGSLTLAACSTNAASGESPDATQTPSAQTETAAPASRPTESPTHERTTSDSTRPTTTPPSPTSSTTTQSTTTTSTTLAPTTTAAPTTTIREPLDVFDPSCVVETESETSFEQIALEHTLDDPVALWFENDRADATSAGQLIDICPGNALDDIDGEPRPVLDESAVAAALSENVERQQTRLNELFAGYGIEDLAVDGDSGPRTGQRLCAARLALGIDTTISDMMPGSTEQAALFATDELPTPQSTAMESERWVLIDRTCQIMFIGTGTDTTFVFPTSTGSEGFETRDQDRSEAFRFNPALDNGGWHDSSEFPVGVDNPLNGNLYKPLYFDLGQAIHGANNVPPTPASKGCARIRVEDQEILVAWLGLDDATGETWRKEEMNVTVNVQGTFVPRP